MILMFYYILAVWKKLVDNNRVLENLLFINDFKILDKKYYLTNIRYYNINNHLYLYYSIYYHLSKQAIVEKKSIIKKTLFNFYHSSF